jgi:hypothetical protein
MSFIFNNWPTVSYDLKKNEKPIKLTNITLRFKIAEIIRNKSAVMYEYNVPDGGRPDIIAYNYYGDASLDWLILLVNNIIDPQFEWPLDDRSFDTYIRKKYSSIENSMQTIHHYEIKIRDSSVTYDGIFVPEKKLIVDLETYNAYDPTMREAVDNYTHERRLNDQRKIIKILDKRFADDIVRTYASVIRELSS